MNSRLLSKNCVSHPFLDKKRSYRRPQRSSVWTVGNGRPKRRCGGAVDGPDIADVLAPPAHCVSAEWWLCWGICFWSPCHCCPGSSRDALLQEHVEIVPNLKINGCVTLQLFSRNIIFHIILSKIAKKTFFLSCFFEICVCPSSHA